MDFSLYFDEPDLPNLRYPFVEKKQAFQVSVNSAFSEESKDLSETGLMIVGFQEQELSVADQIRRELYALADVSQEIFDVGNLKQFENLEGRIYALEELLQWASDKQLVPIFLNIPPELEYTVAKFYFDGDVGNYVTLDSVLGFREETTGLTHDRCLENLIAQPGNSLGYHYVQLGHQDYLTSSATRTKITNSFAELVRLGLVRSRLQEMEPYLRHADLFSVDVSVLKNSECPAQQEIMPNGLYGEEFCQLMYYGGNSINLKAVMIRGLKQGACDSLSARQLAQSIWLLVQAFISRIKEHPTIKDPLFKRFTVTIEKSTHTLRFYKSDRTNRWWFEFPSNNKDEQSAFVACTYTDYLQATENQIPERWLKWTERLAAK
jgi:hypothetical protein